ncbi:unnamed protein product [Adineta steineri]|uniref:Apoptotic chromatin condensation inducer in the nucleus n=1 Tax=Adineta steineri TaxID=433720 RepID=A0A813PEW4_9BILA|nr:unnamed protein product [Adineta steineri]CAF3514162.1 unnamed protein product [Adineta steineri]
MADDQLTNQLKRIESMTNVDLRTELKQRGYSTSGNKKDLLVKLRNALQNEYEENLKNSVDNSQNEISIPDKDLSINDQINTHHSPVVISQTIDTCSVLVNSIPTEIIVSASINTTSDISSKLERKESTIDSQLQNTEQSREDDLIILDTPEIDNDIEVISVVGKNIAEKQNDTEKLGEISCLLTAGNSNAKSDSNIKENPLPNKQHHLNQSTLQQQENNHLSPDLKSTTTQKQDIIKSKELEALASQQQTKPNRSEVTLFRKSLNRSTSNKINLSSELLKTLISDISLAPESVSNNELDAVINYSDHYIEQVPHTSIFETNIKNSDALTIGDLADKKQPTRRTVVMDVIVDSSSINDDLNMRKQITRTSSLESKTLSNEKTSTDVTDEPVRIKHANTMQGLPSQILYISGLTRPFSVFQLKGLLQRYGTLIDNEFWLDKIKSQCFVTYSTLEEAEHAYKELDGCRWPSTNPRTLSVRFGRQDELEFSKIHDLPPDQMSIDSVDRLMQEKTNKISSNRSISPVNGMKVSTKRNHTNVQEVNDSKRQEEIHSGFLITDVDEVIDESPVKDLDDYFRKTKAKPSIYWLPLTEEQVIERAEQRKDKRNLKEKNEDYSEKTSNSKSRNKRKRSSSASPSSRRH